MNTFVLGGLVEAPGELAGDIENTHDALRKMVLDLESLDATILQFDPTYRVETIKPRPSGRQRMEQPGPDARIILIILRQAAEPLTTRDIALQLLVERALDKSDQQLCGS